MLWNNEPLIYMNIWLVFNNKNLLPYYCWKLTPKIKTLLWNRSVKASFPKGPFLKNFFGFWYSIKSLIPFSQDLPLCRMGQNTDVCHLGTTMIPFALQLLMCWTVLAINLGGGTTQQFSGPQWYAKAFAQQISFHVLVSWNPIHRNMYVVRQDKFAKFLMHTSSNLLWAPRAWTRDHKTNQVHK